MTERVVVVTGGGGGIGAAVAEELVRQGAFVVTVDPMVSLDGSEQLDGPAPTSGSRAVSASVTDTAAVQSLFEGLVAEFGRLDAVINVAGISRPTSYTRGSDDDWRAVLDVHLNGYRNILDAALPLMGAAGYGRILGVTSGSGWRAADAGAYGCAKRAVASLTWYLGKHAPAGVVINAMSPIAVTRMVTAALGQAGNTASKTGGLNLGSMPEPEQLGPLAAHLVSDGFDWCSGEVIFAGGSEVAVVEPPRLLEVVQTRGVASLAHLLEGVMPALVQAETTQASAGGSNPRFGSAFAGSGEVATAAISSCAIVSDRPQLSAQLSEVLEARKVTCVRVADDAFTVPDVDAVVVAFTGKADLVSGILTDARWARAVADTSRPMRLVTVTEATQPDGFARAQASAQLARAARKATEARVAHFALSDGRGDVPDVVAFAAHLLCHPDSIALAGAELAAGPGWVGLRSHPRPSTSISLREPTIPDWFDDTLREVVR